MLSRIGVINIFTMLLFNMLIIMGIIKDNIIKNMDVFIRRYPIYFRSFVFSIRIINIINVNIISIEL